LEGQENGPAEHVRLITDKDTQSKNSSRFLVLGGITVMCGSTLDFLVATEDTGLRKY
jgi:hypothetical protein